VTPHGIRVYLETTPKKTFAGALDWPGWCRAGNSDHAALEALGVYEERYRRAIRSAKVVLPEASSNRFEIVERVDGNATTAFGAPGTIVAADREPTDRAAGERLASLLSAAWGTFDEIAAAAPAELRKGPRGGGRDTAKIVDHVMGADQAYAHEVGVRSPVPTPWDAAAVQALRAGILAVLRRPSDGSPVSRRWTVRFLARRSAWHALDHAWEIEDRTET
jgi:hypothetical protein